VLPLPLPVLVLVPLLVLMPLLVLVPLRVLALLVLVCSSSLVGHVHVVCKRKC
jgi:hypothetical protein